MELTEDQISRYSRHILLPEVGGKGQQKLLGSSVLCIGAGGLGSPALFYLAAAGVGRIGIIDGDDVDLTNLQRQIVHTTADIGRAKVESAAERLTALNPDVKLDLYKDRITKENIYGLLGRYDAIVDGCDNFATRFLVNDATYFARKPLFYASVFRYEGQASTFLRGDSEPCYRCLFPEPPPPGLIPSCQEAGIFGAIVGVMGTIQAVECIKHLLNLGSTLNGRLLIFDAARMKFREVRIHKDPNCPLCGKKPTIKELGEYEEVSCEIQTERV